MLKNPSTLTSVIILNNILKSGLIVLILGVAGCATVVPVQTELFCPLPLDLPKLAAVELEALTPEAYRKLVLRDKMLKARVATLCGIIESTHD